MLEASFWTHTWINPASVCSTSQSPCSSDLWMAGMPTINHFWGVNTNEEWMQRREGMRQAWKIKRSELWRAEWKFCRGNYPRQGNEIICFPPSNEPHHITFVTIWKPGWLWRTWILTTDKGKWREMNMNRYSSSNQKHLRRSEKILLYC